MTSHDRRLTPARPDLAAAHLEGVVAAPRYVAGTPRRVVAAVADLGPQPRPDTGIDTQLLYGETFTVYDETPEGWAWGQSGSDGYVGWISGEALGAPGPAPTHRLAALRSFVYPGPDLRLPRSDCLSLGSRVTVTGTATTRGTDYALLAGGGAMVLTHLVPVDAAPADDYVAVAERFVGTPYLWGGRSGFGIDCSGLVQLALAEAGIAAPRDSDQQAAGLGIAVGDGSADPADFRRGDLLFWKGHVAIVAGADTLLHASGFHMTVVAEPLRAALARIATAGTPLAGVRRPG